LTEALHIIFAGSEVSIFYYVNDLFGACVVPRGLRRPEDIVKQLTSHLSEQGLLFWITGREAVYNNRARRTFADFKARDMHVAACIEAPRDQYYTVIVLRRGKPERRFVAVLRDPESEISAVAAFKAGPTRKEGPNWAWLNPEDTNTFRDLERSRLLKILTPRGRHTGQPLSALFIRQQNRKGRSATS
jgi:hypothetical protein